MNDLLMGGPNLSNNFMPTTRTAMAETRLEMLLQLGRQADYCKALPLLGPPGTGKTLFIKEYATLFEKKHKRKLRSLYVEVPSSATTNGLVSTILNRLGDAAPTHGIETAKVARIVGHMLGRFDILYLDEFHRLIDRNTAKWTRMRIPTQTSRRFRCIPAGDSDGSQPVIPTHSSHP
jgi:Cdc6-like AAA superfamily ATPase